MNPSLRVFLAFLAGLGGGIAFDQPALVRVIEPVGTLWINAIRLPIIPLIVAMIISGVASSEDTRRVGTLTARAIGTMLAILVLFAVTWSLLAPVLLSPLTLDPASTASLRASASPAAPTGDALTFTGWLLTLVPVNPVKAAADGALLPLVVFSLAYGLATTRVSERARLAQVEFFRAIADAMLVIIKGVLFVAPLGVFALAFALGSRVGAAAASAVAWYLLVDTLALIAAIGVLYLITVAFGRVRLREFAAAVLPAQTVALSSRSSLAALPVLIADARAKLKLPESALSVVLPLCASIFKPNSPVSWPLGALLVAKLYGIEMDATSLAIFGVGSVLLSFTTPGIPSGGFFVQAPLYVAVGLPPEALGVLIAVDFVPDMFKTALNVTSYATTALLVTRRERE